MDVLNSFFQSLAYRFRKENDLSDVTWAMCQASPTFLRLWINFFFNKLDADLVEDIRREVPAGEDKSSRVDFYIKVKGDETPFLIEVKIGDQNHHFGQYDEDYGIPPERLGYITNYPYKEKGYEVKQWRSFHKYLVGQNISSTQEQELIAGYTDYLKNVCNIVMLNELIDIDKMTGLYGLTVVFQELAEVENEHYDSKLYNNSDGICVRWIFYRVRYRDFAQWPDQYPFVGIHYSYPSVRICGGFDKRKGWAKEAVQFISKNTRLFDQIELKYCGRPYLDGDWYFDLSEYALSAFASAKTIDEQKDVLREFIGEILEFPIKLSQLAIRKEQKEFWPLMLHRLDISERQPISLQYCVYP